VQLDRKAVVPMKRAVAGVPKRALGINDVRWSEAAQLKHTYAVPRR
jgi:hypothetical protein